MFLRCKVRRKDGKQHRYWSVVENTRVAGGRVVQRHVLYLGEINDTQELAWRGPPSRPQRAIYRCSRCPRERCWPQSHRESWECRPRWTLIFGLAPRPKK